MQNKTCISVSNDEQENISSAVYRFQKPVNVEDDREGADNVEAEEEGAEVAELGQGEERDLHREEDKAEEGDS